MLARLSGIHDNPWEEYDPKTPKKDETGWVPGSVSSMCDYVCLADGMGNVRGLVDSSGNVSLQVFDAFGNPQGSGGIPAEATYVDFRCNSDCDFGGGPGSFRFAVNRVGHQGLFFERFDGNYNDQTLSAGGGNPDVTTWAYDVHTGSMYRKTYADNKKVNYDYYEGGSLKSRIWARSVGGQPLTTNYVYDEQTGELTDITYSDAGTGDPTIPIRYFYDRLGRKRAVWDGLGKRNYIYNLTNLQLTGEDTDAPDDVSLYELLLSRQYESAPWGVPGRYNGLQIGNATVSNAFYESGWTYDPIGHFEKCLGPGLSENGVHYWYVPDSDLLQQHEYYTSGSEYGVFGWSFKDYEPDRNLVLTMDNHYYSGVNGIYNYENDSLGRRKQVHRFLGPTTPPGDDTFDLYDYNDRNELISMKRGDGEIPPLGPPADDARHRFFEYDAIGNRQSYKRGGAVSVTPTTYTPNTLNQYDGTADPTEAFAHDFDGNLSQDAANDYQWDAENRLKVVQPRNPAVGSKRLRFSYDYIGRRVQKQVWEYNGTNWGFPVSDTRFVYDGWNLVMELDGLDDNAVLRKYTWGLDVSGTPQGAGGIGGLLAMYDTRGTSATTDDGNYLYFYDGSGNVTQVLQVTHGLGQAATLDAAYDYTDPFGAHTAAGPQTTSNPYRFSTKYFDAEVDYAAAGSSADANGLYYYGYRYYSPRLGRWMSRDPLEQKGLFLSYGGRYRSDPRIEHALDVAEPHKLYLYCENEPIRWVDPLGLSIRDCTPEQEALIERARTRAVAEIDRLNKRINEALQADTGQYPLFTRSKLTVAKEVLACAKWKALQTLNMRCECGGRCTDSYAWINWIFGQTVHLCPSFFKGSLPNGISREKFAASVLVHEATHKCGTIDFGYFWQSGIDSPRDKGIVGYESIASTYDTWILRGFCVPGYNCPRP